VRLFQVTRRFRVLVSGEGGVTLLETILALAIVGIVTVGFFSGMSISSKSTFIADQRNTGQSLAQSQVEYVQQSAYIDHSDVGYQDYESIGAPGGYSVDISATPVDPGTGQALPAGQDFGLQKITVTVSHGTEPVITIETYKE